MINTRQLLLNCYTNAMQNICKKTISINIKKHLCYDDDDGSGDSDDDDDYHDLKTTLLPMPYHVKHIQE